MADMEAEVEAGPLSELKALRLSEAEAESERDGEGEDSTHYPDPESTSSTHPDLNSVVTETPPNEQVSEDEDLKPEEDPDYPPEQNSINSKPKNKKQQRREFETYFKNHVDLYLRQLSSSELAQHCKWSRLSPTGSPKTLRARLRELYRICCKRIFTKMSFVPPGIPHFPFPTQYFQYFDFLVVVDFEATCHQENPPNFLHEIIQFPAVLIDVQQRVIVDEFNIFCKPTLNPVLSEFCTELTGITQDLVADAPDFKQGLEIFREWLIHHQLGTRFRYAIVCDGAWDMGKFLHTQCEISKIPYPALAHRWINIRKSFSSFYNVKWFNLRIMLGLIGQPFQGRPHDGLDDSRNIGNIVLRLLNDGCILWENERILLGKAEQEKNAAIQSHERKLYSLCTVENMNKNMFMRFYNWSWSPVMIGSDCHVDKENVAAAAKAPPPVNGASGGAGSYGNGGGRGNKKRGKPKYKKWTDVNVKESAEAAGNSGSSSGAEGGIIVVSAKVLDD